jgi:hypothetical protein
LTACGIFAILNQYKEPRHMKIKNISKTLFISRAFGPFIFALIFSFASAGAVFAADEQSGINFLVEKSYDFYGRDQTAAFLIYDSENAHFYFDKEVYNSLIPLEQHKIQTLVAKLAEEFDSVIYPETKDIFGDEWSPGIDGDEKIYIFLTRMNYGVGGYFDPVDEYYSNQVADGRSNEHEMIYLNTDYLDKQKAEGFLSHEFQHMIYWNEKTRISGVVDDVWINEGRSELASSIIEDKLNLDFAQSVLAARKRDFLQNYTDSVADWNNLNADYASVSIFSQYIKEQAGAEIFREMNDTRKSGMNNLNYILEREKGIELGDLFTNWTIANYINNTYFDKRYGYASEYLKIDFGVTPNPIYDVDDNGIIELTGSVKNWSADYFKVDLTEEEYKDTYLEMDFNGQDTGIFAMPVIINYKDGSREVDFMKLNSKQDGHREEMTVDGKISSIVFIVSSQKLGEVLKDNQVENHPFSFDIKLTPLSEKIRPNGTLIRAAGDEKVYLIDDGKKRWITDSATFVSRGYDWSSVITVSQTELMIYEEGQSISAGAAPRDGLLVKGSDCRVYLIEGGRRRWVRDEITFVSLGYNWNNILQISDQELFKYIEGQILSKDMPGDGALIKGLGVEVYLLRGGKKCHITSPEVFERNNFSWSSIIIISEEVLASYPDGSDMN